MALAAVLFDLDNTLYHYEPCDTAALQAAHACCSEVIDVTFDAFVECQADVREHYKAALRGHASSRNRAVYFKMVVERLGGRFDPALAVRVNLAYEQAFAAHMSPQPEAHRVLAAASARHPLALVTNQVTSFQLAKVNQLGIGQFFKAMVTSEEAGVEKPDPFMFRLALEKMGLSKSQASACVMVGDHVRCDIGGAAAVGLTTIQTLEFARQTHDSIHADYQIESLGEVVTVLDQLDAR